MFAVRNLKSLLVMHEAYVTALEQVALGQLDVAYQPYADLVNIGAPLEPGPSPADLLAGVSKRMYGAEM